MTHVLTLVAGAAEGALGTGAVDAASAALTGAGAVAGACDWLDPGRACDLPFSAADPAAAHAAAMQALAGTAIDVLSVPAAGRRKRLLLADMEATIIRNELLDDLAAMVGLEAEVSRITARAMAGEIDFSQALRHRVSLFRDLPRACLERAADGIRQTPGAAALVATMRRTGARTALVSGGFTYFVDRVGRELGFDETYGNELGWKDGRLSGEVARLAVTAEGKRRTLAALAARLAIAADQTLAIGDGANDVPMLTAAGLGMGFRPKPIVADAVPNRIVHGDLTAALFVQGYRRAEFAAG
jgi:phosphoserine phosphatase